MQEKKMVRKNLRTLLLKKYQRADLKSHGIGLGYLIYVKIFVKFCFLCGTFIRNFRLVLTILTLVLNKKHFPEMDFKQIIRRF